MDYEGMSREELLAVLRGLDQAPSAPSPGELDARRLLHELQVHQIDLEMQNRALREAQGALEESRNRYADLYDYAPAAYCTLSEGGIVEELNLTAATLFGMPRELAQGRPLTSLVRLEDPKLLWHHLGECAARQAPLMSELSLVVNGNHVAVEAVSVPVMEPGQRGRRFRTAFTDITRRKAAERALEETHASEQRLRQRLQALDAAQIEVAARLTQNAADTSRDLVEIITRHARDLFHVSVATLQLAADDEASPPERAEETPAAAQALSPHRTEVELEYAGQRLGTLTLLRAPLQQPFSERDHLTLSMFAARIASGLQIARLHHIEARESERLWLLARVGSELKSVHDRLGAHSAIARILDGTCQRLCQTGLVFLREDDQLKLAHVTLGDAKARTAAECDAPELTDRVSAWLAACEGPQPQQVVVSDASADETPLSDVPQRLAALLGATSLLLMPLQVRDRQLGLFCLGRTAHSGPFTAVEVGWCAEIAVRCSLSLENVRLFEELRAALDWRETLLATISHDLKSPLSAISLSASALVPEEPMPERRRTGRQVDLIRRSADYMNNMVNDLLLENMISSGGFQLDLHRQQVSRLVMDACQMAEPLAAARSVSLEQYVESGLPDVAVDRERLLRVFSNLIGNASKFSPQGASIRVHARRAPEGIAFSVSDSGPGIALDQQPSLFKRYWRGNKGPRGLGLGLYIAKTIVEAHGGHIRVSSPPGEGATFTFTVPLGAR